MIYCEAVFWQDPKYPKIIWVFPKIGVPQNGWFILENPIKIYDLGEPLFSETPILVKSNRLHPESFTSRNWNSSLQLWRDKGQRKRLGMVGSVVAWKMSFVFFFWGGVGFFPKRVWNRTPLLLYKLWCWKWWKVSGQKNWPQATRLIWKRFFMWENYSKLRLWLFWTWPSVFGLTSFKTEETIRHARKEVLAFAIWR